MNRRQFLTGASAIAVSAALPIRPVVSGFNLDNWRYVVRYCNIETSEALPDQFWQRYRELAELATRQIADSIYNNDYGHGGLAALLDEVDIITECPPCPPCTHWAK